MAIICCSSVSIKAVLIGVGVVEIIAGVVYFYKYHWKEAQQTGTGLQTSSLDTDVDPKVKDLHFDMVRKLGGYFCPTYKPYWDDLCVLMRKYLDHAKVYGEDINNIGILFEHLMAKETISYGEYDTIVKDFKHIHVHAAAIIEEASACIRRIRSNKPSYAELEQKVNDMGRKSQEVEQKLRRAYEIRMRKMSEQHAKEITEKNQEITEKNQEITEKNQEIETLRQRIPSEEGTISADHEQGPSNIRQRRTALNAFVAT